MFFLFPLGVGEARVRIPIVAGLIALVCVGAFLPTWVFTDDPLNRERLVDAVGFWSEHPYLTIDGDFVRKTLGRQAAERLEAMRTQHHAELEALKPAPDVLVKEQARLDQLVAAAQARDTWLRRFSLVPARGLAQPGWLTAMFLHYGWLHLLGNLFFLWLAAPLLEDAWGRAFFAAVYLASGLAASFAHFLIDPDSPGTMAGASGAIAGLMGAFAVRFPLRRIAIGYFIYFVVSFRRGIWHWPAWFAAALWFADQAWDYFLGETGGVAVGAHLGGFAFGAVVALAMKFSGLDRELVTTDEGATDLSKRHVSKGVEAARAAVEEREYDKAKALLEAELATHPTDSDARLMLAGLELSTPGRTDVANKHFVRALLEACTASPEHGAELWLEHGLRFGAQVLTPQQAQKLAQVVAASPDPNVAQSALKLYERAADAPGLVGQKAGLETARRLWSDVRDANATRRRLEHLLDQPTLPEVLANEARALLEQLPEKAPSSGLELDDRRPGAAASFGAGPELEPPPPEDDPPAQVVEVRGVAEGQLTLGNTTTDVELPLSAIEAVSVGVVPMGGAKVLLVELFSPLAPPLRLVSTTANLQAFRKAESPKALYRDFLLELLGHGATPLFDRAVVEGGQFPAFASLEAYEQVRVAARRRTKVVL
ncbi:MAG: rhomboid family intramembrane serine protease [Myxococcaceae bacterium]|nr:rhomboid family intramembrane serine protease [Myxococcaceae bacterium]